MGEVTGPAGDAGGPVLASDLLARLPAPSAPADARAHLRASLAGSRAKVVVVDDDPTGTQVVADVPVVTAWSDDDLGWALDDPGSMFFVLTNSRSMDGARAAAVNVELGERLVRLAGSRGMVVRCVSRSDSTLRGHFPGEVDALVAGLKAGGQRTDGVILCPAFISAGRCTVDDVHYVRDGEWLIPVAATEFARDQTFHYAHSDLVEWAVEHGVERSRIVSLTLHELRLGGVDYVVDRLGSLDGGVAIANATDTDDLLVLALGLDRLERAGRSFVYRTGPSFPAARAGLEPREPLKPGEIGSLPGPGLLVVGSHTALSTRQLERARHDHDLRLVALDVNAVGPDGAEVRRCQAALLDALADGDTGLVTSREVRAGLTPEASLAIAGEVADALVEVVAAIPASQPLGWVVAKGGITSSDIAVRAFAARRARVIGQVFRYLVAVWELDAASARGGVPYVVFPGNVGDDQALSSTIDTLKRHALTLPAERLRSAYAHQRALAAFSVYNLEQAVAVCAAAEETGAEVLIQAGSSAFAYAGRDPLAALALACARDSSAAVGVHLDHSRDLDEVRYCLALGYTSVMFDGSALDLADNERLTGEVVRLAHAVGGWVEAELAGISGDEDSSRGDAAASAMTDPDVAARFVERTGVDALAVAIGNVHGIPATPVHLDLDRLAAIRERVPVPLVLHGASGLDDGEVLGAIRLGVAKINVNTELRRALAAHLGDGPAGRDDLASLLGPSRRAMQAVAAAKIRLYGSVA